MSSMVLDVNECGSAPCQNSGICIDSVAGYHCSCSAGYKGIQCEMGKLNYLICMHKCMTINVFMLLRPMFIAQSWALVVLYCKITSWLKLLNAIYKRFQNRIETGTS